MLSSSQIRLVPLSPDHLENTLQWMNDPALMRLLDRVYPISQLEHQEWYAKIHTNKTQLYFAVESISDGCHIGNVWLYGIDYRHRRAELRIVIGSSDYHGNGIGTEIIALLCDFAFTQLNLHKIYAYVLEINPRAKRAFEKAGFSVEGTLKADRWCDDRYIDVYFLGRIRDD